MSRTTRPPIIERFVGQNVDPEIIAGILSGQRGALDARLGAMGREDIRCSDKGRAELRTPAGNIRQA